ncbi:reverse transcriptase domain-containing protein [Tanacetum coccineum]|uniref:Reverse transcriptase domain-containing protein n=1 Tax=Tanacetum coccineum TaxID=301880 RepID=A0ABQ4XSR3_9ASTR
MLRVFPISLIGAASRWLRNEPTGSITTWEDLKTIGAIPTKTAEDAKKVIQEMAEYSQKWHNRTSRGRSTETSDGIAAIQAQLNNLGREIKKVNEKVYATQVGCEKCKGPHYTKDCPLKEEGKTLEEAYYTKFGGPFQGGGYRAAAPGFYQRNNVNPSYQERRQSIEDTLSKFMNESKKRHEENSNLIKDIRASIDASIRNQGASIKTLEIQIGQMSKIIRPFLGNCIELNDLNEPFELKRNQGDDLMPIIEEGEVIEEFRTRDEDLDTVIDDYPSYCDSDKKIHIDCGYNLKFSCMIGFEFTHANFFPLLYVNVMTKKFHISIVKDKMVYKGNNVVGTLLNVPIFVGNFSVVTDFTVLKNMDAYRDEGMCDVIFGELFLREVRIKARRFDGTITLYKDNDEDLVKEISTNIGNGYLRKGQKRSQNDKTKHGNGKEHEKSKSKSKVNSRASKITPCTTEGYAGGNLLHIPAEHFELKHSLINLVTSKQFFGFEKGDPHAHIRYFKLKYKDMPEESIKLMLFPFSIDGPARIWLDKEPPRSILTWDDLVSKFINHFFPPSKTTNLQNEISNFNQKFEETFSEAWDRFKDLLRACPHHGFTELHQLDTFYNGLNPSDQDSLNSAAGGNLLERSAQDVLKIIENKSKVRNSRNKPIVSQVKTSNVDSSEIASDVTSAMTMMFKQHQVPQLQLP